MRHSASRTSTSPTQKTPANGSRTFASSTTCSTSPLANTKSTGKFLL
jgi:hypothetical protein